MRHLKKFFKGFIIIVGYSSIGAVIGTPIGLDAIVFIGVIIIAALSTINIKLG